MRYILRKQFAPSTRRQVHVLGRVINFGNPPDIREIADGGTLQEVLEEASYYPTDAILTIDYYENNVYMGHYNAAQVRRMLTDE